MTAKRLFVFAAALALGTGAAQAGTLVGTGTYDTTDDLTRVDIGGGTILEFLDLTKSTNRTASQAVSDYSAGGFTWAKKSEVDHLLGAFSLPTTPDPVTSWAAISVSATGTAIANFQSYLGVTLSTGGNTFSLGLIDDELNDGKSAFVSPRTFGGTGPNVFVNHTNSFGVTNNGFVSVDTGYYLVRADTGGGPVEPPLEPPSAVPLPAPILGLGAGLVALLGLRRRKSAA